MPARQLVCVSIADIIQADRTLILVCSAIIILVAYSALTQTYFLHFR
jgi:hypothetical protein